MAHSTPESRAPAVERGHEIFDLDMSYLHWFALGVVVLLIVAAVAAFALLGGFRVPRPAMRTAPAAEESAAVPFATLQSAPQDELRAYRRSKAAALEGYRWVDRSGGVVQIPIERAMQLVAVQAQKQEAAGDRAAAPAAAAPAAGAPASGRAQ